MRSRRLRRATVRRRIGWPPRCCGGWERWTRCWNRSCARHRRNRCAMCCALARPGCCCWRRRAMPRSRPRSRWRAPAGWRRSPGWSMPCSAVSPRRAWRRSPISTDRGWTRRPGSGRRGATRRARSPSPISTRRRSTSPRNLGRRRRAASAADRLGALPAGNPRHRDTGFDRGEFWVQDAAAALPARLLAARAGERVADLCAAPGGKTAQLAAAGAAVVAVERDPARLARLRENLRHWHLTAEIVQADAAALGARRGSSTRCCWTHRAAPPERSAAIPTCRISSGRATCAR